MQGAVLGPLKFHPRRWALPQFWDTVTERLHCLLQRGFPLFPVVLSTGQVTTAPQAENAMGAVGITAEHTETSLGEEMGCSIDLFFTMGFEFIPESLPSPQIPYP